MFKFRFDWSEMEIQFFGLARTLVLHTDHNNDLRHTASEVNGCKVR